MDEVRSYLEQRKRELRDAQAQAIHSLGVVTGRLEEIELLIQRLDDEQEPVEQ